MAENDFARVYADRKDDVWRLASKYVFSQQDREDLFQEVFLNIHKALPRFRKEASVNTWVYRITVNTAINYLKKKNRYQWLKKMLDGMRHIGEEMQDVPTDVQLLKPLEKLNPQQRMILILADIEEKKLDEIAEALKMPVGTVKSNLHRAREIVKKEVSKNGGL